MARDYSSVPEKDLAAGINQQAPEDSIPAGFVEHALNVDFNSEGLVEKRAGFRNYLGNLPIRVAEVKQENGTPDKLIFNLTSNEHPNLDIDLSNVPPGPILVVGRTGASITDFGATYTAQYYPTFESNPRKQVLANEPNGFMSFPQSEHGISSSDFFVGMTESLSQTNKSNEHFFANGVEINKTNFDVSIPYQNLDGAFEAFVYALRLPGAGNSYSSVHTGTSINIPATTHNLNTFNILCKVFEDAGTSWKEVIPDELIVNENTGNVSISFSESGTYKVLLYAAPVAQQYIDAISGNTVGEFTIPNLEGDFIFLDCFLRDAGTGNLSRIMPQKVTVDVITTTATVTFANEFTLSQNIVFSWEYAKVKSTTLTVTPVNSVTANATEIQPELCIYGLIAEEIFPAKEAPRSGWVQHIDTYKSEGFNTVVAGMGWNLFQAVKQADAASYLRSIVFYPSLRARARASATLAPLFHETIDESLVTRTRGAITFEGGASGWAILEAIQWSEASQGYWVTVDTPNRENVTRVGQDLLTLFTNTTRWGDLLSIRGAELRDFNGEWPVWQVDYSVANKVKFLIKPLFTSADYDCSNSGEAGIFTDRFAIDHRPLLTRGDLVSAQSFPQGVLLGYIGTDRSIEPYLYVSGVGEEVQVANGQLINFSRDSKFCFGPRTADGQQRSFVLSGGGSLPVLRGDSILVSSRAEPVEVAHVMSQELTGITASISEEVLTLTNVTNARQFSVGQRVLVHDLGYDAQEFEVTEIGIDNTTLTLSAPGVLDMAPLSGCKLLPQLEFSEIVSITDDSFNRGTFTIEGRWEAIEKPQIDSANLAAYNAVDVRMTEHFKSDEYGTQSVLRSTMSQNNLYLTNGKDPVMKFDGFTLYRAGLPRWNPQLFVRVQKTGGSITNAGKVWYYFRLGGYDANGNFVVSATTGVQDYKVTIPNNTSNVHLRLVSLPVWDNYDFEKLVVQVYRTESAATPIAPFYLIAELEMKQTIGGGYIDFIDTESNVTLKLLPQDKVIKATAGDALSAVTLSEPLRAKYITSLNNRIVLGNIRGYQQMSLRFVKANAAITFSDFDNRYFTLYKDAQDLTSTGSAHQVSIGYVSSGQALVNNPVETFSSGFMTIPLLAAAPAHIEVGEWVYLCEISSNPAHNGDTYGLGWYQITAIDRVGPDYSITVYAPTDVEDATKIDISHAVFRTASMPVGTVPVLLNINDTNFEYVDGYGSTSDNVLTITHRTAAAINCFTRMVNTNIAGQSAFKPWIMADAGGEFDRGTLRLRRPLDAGSFAFKITTDWPNISVIYNGLQYDTTMTLVSQAPVFPSRVIYSYQNFPELFNKADQRLITLADSDSHLPVDVNSADGQEITGIIPFFGESAFGQATRESLLVVFKTNSIYLIDLSTDRDGNVAGGVQKIESQGLGCTAPYSIAPTKDGIMFANESGIYKLTRQLTVEPIGQFVDRIWREEVDLAQLSLAQGHHYGVGRQYKLSVPLQDAVSNTDVLVYEHTRESRGQPGAWGRYDGHEATGWANLLDEEFFATVHARVCTRRKSATKWDYSDRGTAVVATVALRPNDLGIPNTRKRLLHVSVHFRNPQEETLNISQESTTVELATDLKEDFLPCDKYESSGLFSRTGMSDLGLIKGETVRFSVPTSKAIQYQVKIENSGLYETLQFSGITYRVSAMSTKGTKEADDTSKK